MLENHSKLHKAMTVDQFTQVVEAILEGKYSWACVLILRFAGYNPLHYIPYRTYNRLMKENSQNCKRQQHAPKAYTQHSEESRLSNSNCQIEDLGYLETVKQKQALIKGGSYIWSDVEIYKALRLTAHL
ncbi:HetP family heterocyst commitment protein [Leptolyngbya sp. 7M]|uniref:HetP family heterocyst commitment protein n=1 Tax=Leptolyngbya sp. 7M TaxID=2812896 RepID=UPI001B8BA461|nr:HetP family heterocyst commitment protein [Leptolyngbya sp. 7M]QYO62012.1 HetP family heterocyst commitment protein [Leptolyngbya sp. 7M]